MDEYDNELKGIFDNLKAEDFAQETTAIQEVSHPGGSQTFDDFVAEQTRSLQIAYAAATGAINPVAVLATKATQRMFLPTEEETLGAYIERLHTEAARMKATRLFIARKTLVAARLIPEDQVQDVASEDMIKDAHERGILEPGVVWYAEHYQDGGRLHRVGVMFDNDGKLDRPSEAPPSSDQRMEVFEGILS